MGATGGANGGRDSLARWRTVRSTWINMARELEATADSLEAEADEAGPIPGHPVRQAATHLRSDAMILWRRDIVEASKGANGLPTDRILPED